MYKCINENEGLRELICGDYCAIFVLMIYDGMIPILWALFQLEGVTWCLDLLVPGERTLLLIYCSHLHVQIFPEKEI